MGPPRSEIVYLEKLQQRRNVHQAPASDGAGLERAMLDEFIEFGPAQSGRLACFLDRTGGTLHEWYLMRCSWHALNTYLLDSINLFIK